MLKWILMMSTTLIVNSLQVTFPLKAAQLGDQMVVVDNTGNRVKLACVNWYGAHMENLVVNGLDVQPMKSIAAKIAELGFNCVRLPFALDTYYIDPLIPEASIAANPDLYGKTAMEIFDATIKALADEGLIILLNNHISKAMWCCNDSDGEGLWYTPEYPEETWENCLLGLTTRYLDNPFVAGMDLRNEIRSANGVSGAWGNGQRNDWAQAAEKIGNLILELNPDMLIIVEGLEYSLNIMGARDRPIVLSQPEKLIYSGHIYPFSSSIADQPYAKFKETMISMQTYVAEAGHPYSAPYWMGEFGTGDDGKNWNKIVQFLQETDHDWAYWSIDGYKYPGEDESYGILEKDYKTVRHQWKLEQLQTIMKPQK